MFRVIHPLTDGGLRLTFAVTTRPRAVVPTHIGRCRGRSRREIARGRFARTSIRNEDEEERALWLPAAPFEAHTGTTTPRDAAEVRPPPTTSARSSGDTWRHPSDCGPRTRPRHVWKRGAGLRPAEGSLLLRSPQRIVEGPRRTGAALGGASVERYGRMAPRQRSPRNDRLRETAIDPPTRLRSRRTDEHTCACTSAPPPDTADFHWVLVATQLRLLPASVYRRA
jgi:hypothetical protein